MKILITGADGFSGRFFMAHATAKGHKVLPLTVDLTNPEALQQNVRQSAPDAVVHLAAISYVGHADANAFYAVNVVGTTNLLTALSQLPVPPHRILLASSANVYGNSQQSPIVESQTPTPVNHYATSKLAMEHMARTFSDRLNLIITRPFNYTGPGQSVDFVIPKLVQHFARRAPSIELGNLNVEREFNDVEMICSTYLQLLRFGEPGETYNVCSGQPYTLQQVIGTLSKITGHQLRVEVSPVFFRANEVYRLCGSPGKLKALLTIHGEWLINPPLEDTLRRMLAVALATK